MSELTAGLAVLTDAASRIVATLWDGPAPPLVGIGWATVDLDRAERELGGALATGAGGVFTPAPPDRLLGAACRTWRPDPGGPWLVLLEPSTEGRIAAALARHGEGVAVAYVQPPRAAGEPPINGARAPDDTAGTAPELDRRSTGDGPLGAADGPLGAARLLAGGRAGPYLVAVEPRGHR